MGEGQVVAHFFQDSCVYNSEKAPAYWRDVGTIDAYWEANIDLTATVPELNLYDRSWPIWTYQEQLPPAKFVHNEANRRGEAIESSVSAGCILSGSVHNSLLFSNCRVHSYTQIHGAVLLPEVQAGDPALEQMAGGAGSAVGTGGMLTKVLAARRAARSGTSTIVCSGA